MERKASAVWRGDLKSGRGTISTASGVLSNTQYSFSTRFKQGAGTNPEERVPAAHAGCFSMALSAQLGNAGLAPESIETRRLGSTSGADFPRDIRITHWTPSRKQFSAELGRKVQPAQ